MAASHYGCAEIVRILLENGAHVDLQDENGLSALMKASENGQAHVVKILLENGAQINLKNESLPVQDNLQYQGQFPPFYDY